MRRYREVPIINKSSGGGGQMAICPYIGIRLLASFNFATSRLTARLLAFPHCPFIANTTRIVRNMILMSKSNEQCLT
jgi:hypothetical protein